jgi:putative hydrolase of the HAD superfamily
LAFDRARNLIRAAQGTENGAPETRARNGNFYEIQARFTADILKKEPSVTGEKIERLIYRGWEPLFKKIGLFPHVRETLEALRAAGLKTGMLSDFPPDAKLEYLGLAGLWDAVLCSERVGALKPDPRPFEELAAALSLEPGQILYVGNSFRYDVTGAKRAGMKAAWLTGKRRRKREGRAAGDTGADGSGAVSADFSFFNYRQLREYVLS